jgi:hypothetical protein
MRGLSIACQFVGWFGQARPGPVYGVTSFVFALDKVVLYSKGWITTLH